MSKQELGVKRDCPECGARFYDLNKEPAHCPKCGNDFTPEPLLKPRKPRPDDAPAEQPEKVEKPSAETSLEDADDETAEAKSKRKAGLDEDEDIDELEDINIEIEDDDEDDDTLLDDDDDSDDVSGIISGGDNDDDT
ncbi:MAG: TIGR02300 family protein [Alphaproteobacteria bacterium]|nr:TIGR02300 family protein [Alphaproteobacteria bacterium]